MRVTAELVQQLRDRLGDAPINECKQALLASNGDLRWAEEMCRTRTVPSDSDIKIMRLAERVTRLEALVAQLVET